MIKFILLGLLYYTPKTGYELKQIIDTSTAHFWHAYHSQIYTILRQMEKEGLVTSEFIQEDDALKRRVYSITIFGQNSIKAWLDQPMEQVSQVKEELLVRLFFSAQRDSRKVIDELRNQQQLHQNNLLAYRHIQMDDPNHNHPQIENLERNRKFWQITLDMGFRYEKMYLEWLENSIKTIEELEE